MHLEGFWSLNHANLKKKKKGKSTPYVKRPVSLLLPTHRSILHISSLGHLQVVSEYPPGRQRKGLKRPEKAMKKGFGRCAPIRSS